MREGEGATPVSLAGEKDKLRSQKFPSCRQSRFSCRR